MTAPQPPEWDRMPWPAKQRWMQLHGQPVIDLDRRRRLVDPLREGRRAQAAAVLYRLGMSIREIARIQRITPKRVRQGLARLDVPLRPSGGSLPRSGRKVAS